MIHWRSATFALLLVWVLPGRYDLEVREPAEDVWPNIQERISKHRAENGTIVLSNLTTEGGNFLSIVREKEATEADITTHDRTCYECSSKVARYFRHQERRWHWPWWKEKPYPSMYTHQITESEVLAHGHVRYEPKGDR